MLFKNIELYRFCVGYKQNQYKSILLNNNYISNKMTNISNVIVYCYHLTKLIARTNVTYKTISYKFGFTHSNKMNFFQ